MLALFVNISSMVEPLFDLNQVGFLKSVQAFSTYPKLVWVYFPLYIKPQMLLGWEVKMYLADGSPIITKMTLNKI